MSRHCDNCGREQGPFAFIAPLFRDQTHGWFVCAAPKGAKDDEKKRAVYACNSRAAAKFGPENI